MFEHFILGVIQGVAEWLPVSSEGFIFLAKTHLFGETDIGSIVEEALFLHLGTFLAVLVYLRKKIRTLLKSLYKYKEASVEQKNILQFLLIATFISGLLGYVLITFVEENAAYLQSATDAITLGVGILLIITAFLQYRAKYSQKINAESSKALKNYKELNKKDGFILGAVQSMAALPGLSRSGLTVSALLLRKFDDNIALELSFLLSLPIVLGGNIILNADKLTGEPYAWIGLLSSFIFGLLTIDLLLKTARKVNFAHFVLFFGLLSILAVLI
ncbi:MAG: undecaprenyl-diphosphate phosphatase [Patescibacteria group bacterium]